MSIDTLDTWAFAAAAWLATYLMHSTLWLASAWLLVRLLRSPALAEWIWRAALVGGLVTASLHGHIGGLDPAVGVRVAPPRLAPAVIALEPPVAGLERPARPQGLETATLAEPEAPRSAAAGTSGLFGLLSAADGGPVRWYHAVAGLWFLGAAVALAHLMHLRRRLRLLLAHRRPVEGGPVAEALTRVREAAGSTRDVRLTQSARLASPVALAGDEICVPERARELGPRELETMLAHELAHLERRDPAWLRATSTLERILFPQPLNRLAARRLEEAAEYLCDERAVAWTGEGVALARCLHEVATWRGAGAPGLAPPGLAPMVRPASPLVARVQRALEGGVSSPTSGQRAAVATWALTGLVLLACQGPGISAESAPAAEPPQATEFTLLVPLNAGVDPEAAWPELEREVEVMYEANREANGGHFSPQEFEASWEHLLATRPRPTGDGTALRAVVRMSDETLEWVEREVGTISYTTMVSDGSGAPVVVSSGPRARQSGGEIVVSSSPRAEPSTLEVRADGSVMATIVLPRKEGQPLGVTQAVATQVRAGDDFPERIHKLLAYAASQMPRAPRVKSVPAEGLEGLGYVDEAETFPSSQVVLKVHPGAEFGTVLAILEACGKPDVRIWNLAFEVEGEAGKQLIDVPLPTDVAAVPAGGQGPARIELAVKVVTEGARVDPETGEDWSGEGPFRFRGREVMYTATSTGALPSGGQASAGGYTTEPGDVLMGLEMARKQLPGAALVIDAEPGVVYGDLVRVVSDAREAGIPVRFVAHRNQDK
jgi:hypothetical protein